MLDFTLNLTQKELSFGRKMKKSQEEEQAALNKKVGFINKDLEDLVPRVEVPSPMK